MAVLVVLVVGAVALRAVEYAFVMIRFRFRII